ncbi:colicin import membrane protein [Bradyrhizobium japonicum]
MLDMPRKLKTYQTSQGFYDLAIAAPSMKAALEAWGASSNLFHQGFAKEVDDEDIIATTMEKPGVVLQRPVGSSKAFSEHSGLPTIESLGSPATKIKEPRKKTKPSAKPTKTGEQQARKAALAFEQERQRREKQRQKEEAAAAKARERRRAALEKAEAALESAEQGHEAVVAEIEKDRAAVERRADAEQERWEKVRVRLRAALREAGE